MSFRDLVITQFIIRQPKRICMKLLIIILNILTQFLVKRKMGRTVSFKQ